MRFYFRPTRFLAACAISILVLLAWINHVGTFSSRYLSKTGGIQNVFSTPQTKPPPVESVPASPPDKPVPPQPETYGLEDGSESKPGSPPANSGGGAGKKLELEAGAIEAGANGATQQEELGMFWAKWAKAMYEARPQTSKIRLNGEASTKKPHNDREARRKYNNFVANPQTEIDRLRDAHKQFRAALDGLASSDLRPFHGRGIVSVGGGEYFGPIIISLHMLRRSGSTLPAEIFVPNDEEYEAKICEEYLPKLNARCVVLSQIISRSGDEAKKLDFKHYQLKAPAMLLSSFKEVLLLDSDSIPLVDPEEYIFQEEPYISNGLIVWPDFWASTESPLFWEIAGVSEFPIGLPATSTETGQLFINKGTHLATALLATYYNVFGQGWYYPLLSQGALGQGDKETFMAAAVVLGSPYYRVATSVEIAERFDGRRNKGSAMIQHLPSEDQEDQNLDGKGEHVRPAFLHSNTPKMNAGHLVDEGDLMSVDKKVRLRLLGEKKDQVNHFGFDVEGTIWDLLVQTGCELAGVIKEWKNRKRLCERLQEHHDQLFGHH